MSFIGLAMTLERFKIISSKYDDWFPGIADAHQEFYRRFTNHELNTRLRHLQSHRLNLAPELSQQRSKSLYP